MIPGSNILARAAGLIGQQVVAWSQFQGMTTSAAGFEVPTWADPVDIPGSLQPVSATLVQQLGLDMTRNYVTFFASANFGDVDRDKTGDRLAYAGRVYQIESKTPWHAQDGWEYVVAVEVTNA